MTFRKALWAGSMLFLVGCTIEPTGAEANTVDFGSLLNGELARCEATGHTREKCCDDHDIDPCPSMKVSFDPAITGRRGIYLPR